jgi:hypothetical protein
VVFRRVPSARVFARVRVTGAAALALLAGCAQIEGLVRFDAVEGTPALSVSPEAGSTFGAGSTPSPGSSDRGAAAGEAGVIDGSPGPDSGQGDAGDGDATPPPSGDLARNASIRVTATTGGTPESVVDGNPDSYWQGPDCPLANDTNVYTCAQPLSLDLSLETAATVNRVVVQTGIGGAKNLHGNVLQGTLTVVGTTTYSTDLTFSAHGDADVTFPDVTDVTSVSVVILTVGSLDPIVTEIQVFGP